MQHTVGTGRYIHMYNGIRIHVRSWGSWVDVHYDARVMIWYWVQLG